MAEEAKTGMRFRVPLYVLKRDGDDAESRWESWHSSFEKLMEWQWESVANWLSDLAPEDVAGDEDSAVAELLRQYHAAKNSPEQQRALCSTEDALDLFCEHSDSHGWAEWSWRVDWLVYDVDQVETITE
jgi:hypothetical protein